MQGDQEPGFPHLQPCGDQALTVTFSASLHAAANRRACAFAARLREQGWPFVTDVVNGFTTVSVHYRAAERSDAQMRAQLWEQLSDSEPDTATLGRLVEIPVCYGGEHGPDLDALARRSGVPARTLIERHAAQTVQVFMLGFAPGLPYLGLWDEPAFKVARRETPRERVPAGSVAVANGQGVIYPVEIPGGWHLIGRTPLTLFRPTHAESPALLAPGDRVRFVPISPQEFAQHGRD